MGPFFRIIVNDQVLPAIQIDPIAIGPTWMKERLPAYTEFFGPLTREVL